MSIENRSCNTNGEQLSIFAIAPLTENSEIYSIYPDPGRHHMLWVSTGEGFINTVGNTCAIEDGVVYSMSRGQAKKIIFTAPSRGYSISIPADLLYIGRSASPFSTKQSLYGGPFSLRMDESTLTDTEDILNRIIKESALAMPWQQELMEHLFKLFLLYLAKRIPVHDISLKWDRDFQLVRRFMDLLIGNITERKRVSSYARELYVSPGYLNMVVKKVSGFTASYHIQQQVVEEAKKIVITTGCSMKDVAYSLGFDDTAHFSKFFKANAGTNFTSFRKALAG
ncbi:helix-turn-helix domain-containing protein [Chitinophaga sp. CF418]|uniref:helix-turn-helix domain-containing protein n=1 Tax=Chitinophaga sp. CF418 TaxID=1855287 RepID=UPI0009118E54|nr:helix-turn-helix domain-containing protein [Chitinophaga sp. CF418]SHL96877.1 AraC-type DNA-binding protein [Chitinophaga sp. CF418]